MWDTKYRPLKFSDVLGQSGAVQVLKARLRNGTALDTNYIFSGGPGQGKTTLARILARAVLCQQLNKEDPDPCNECDNCQAILDETSGAFVERDAASQGTVDHMRSIVEDLPFAVFGAAKRVYLFDECHRMSKDAQDVLLKPLEERRMLGMFCTTEPEKIRGAIRTRCEEHQIRKITRDDILGRMQMVLRQEGVDFTDEGVLVVVDYCGGGVRDTINKLEMIAQTGPVTVDSAKSYLNLSVVSTFYEILLKMPGDTKEALQLLDRACERVTPEEVASGLAEAAMNSFRLANGMLADFAYADRQLGQQVFEQYKAQTVKLAEYFLRSKYTTQIGLVCDLVGLAEAFRGGRSLPTATVSAPVSIAPIQVQTVAPAPVQVSRAPTPPPAPAPVVQAPAPSVPKPAEPKKALPPGVRSDGVGNIGQDPMALTEYDVNGVPRARPKQQNHTPLVLNYGNDTRTQDDSRKILTPAEWRQSFESLLRGVSYGSA